MKLRRLDGVIVSRLVNVRYLTGFTGTAGLLLVTEDAATFYTDFRYEAQASQQVVGPRVSIEKRSLIQCAARDAKRHRLRAVAIESHHVTVDQKADLARLSPETDWLSAQRVVESLRLSKTPDEIAILRQAIEITDGAFVEVLGKLRSGMTERDVAQRLERALQRRDSDGPAFETIVASGVRSALPHGAASGKKLEHGDLVTIDFGGAYKGYCADLTRTVCIGKANSDQKRVYRIVRDAQLRAEEVLRAGLTGRDVDAAAREHIVSKGYGDRFGHGLGHGVGIEVHEAPNLSRTYRSRLRSGSVVTVEPGIYITDWGGVRIEDVAVVMAKGCEVLTRAPKPARLPEL
ncbi:MAG: hypothetical protein AUJ92_02960 [Armatimonadetes bacterium CG2_30_59_28]|nr:MAG: hypothetical protein AUJ92_02960 [Armatimonadetes bacterium CG2_30_59_28]